MSFFDAFLIGCFVGALTRELLTALNITRANRTNARVLASMGLSSTPTAPDHVEGST